MDLLQLLGQPVDPVIWLAAGLMLMGISVLTPHPLLAAMGFAGLVTALVALSVPILAKQLLIWGILSSAILLIFYGLMPRPGQTRQPVAQAQVSERIAAGKVGRVFYNGVQWNARCQISDVAIAPEQRVSVVGRQGNTLIVLPAPIDVERSVNRVH